jgi:hypothetical protein
MSDVILHLQRRRPRRIIFEGNHRIINKSDSSRLIFPVEKLPGIVRMKNKTIFLEAYLSC